MVVVIELVLLGHM